MKKKVILFFVLIFFFLMVNNTRALLISPPILNIDYEPGKTVYWGFNVGGIREENAIGYYSLYATEELNQSIKITSNKSIILSTGKWIPIGGTMIIPPELKPGIHKAGIVVVQTPENPNSGIIAVIGVEYVINVMVPYPGKYIEGTLDVRSVKVNEPVNFIIKLVNRGSEKVLKADIDLDVFDSNNEKAGEIHGSIENLETNSAQTIELQWDSRNKPYGIYRAVAKIKYDGGSDILQKEFRLGDLVVDIINITGNYIEKGTIGKIIIHAQSQSNDFVEAYALVELNTKNEILQLKSSQISIDPFSIRDFQVFLDTSSIDVGDYEAKAKLFYEDKVTEKEFNVYVTRNLFKSMMTTQTLLIFVIILLLVIVILNLIKFKRYKRNTK
ncbi:MAG: hypothetical protein AABW41_04735 [Nanoarchaeota archaeon]